MRTRFRDPRAPSAERSYATLDLNPQAPKPCTDALRVGSDKDADGRGQDADVGGDAAADLAVDVEGVFGVAGHNRHLARLVVVEVSVFEMRPSGLWCHASAMLDGGRRASIRGAVGCRV